MQNSSTTTTAVLTSTAKPILKSKTFWLQVLAITSAFVPGVREWLAANPETAVGALGALNILVRFMTSDRVQLFPASSNDDSDDSGETTTGAGGSALVALLVCVAAGLIGVALSSCSQSVPIDATLTTPNGSIGYSSKSGITANAVIEAEVVDADSGK
ncbi:hypothetical protein JIN85_16980 [Luteolibacter pohnpeiensis]|uniref:Uncharacterized protein n=1 Tax=Luteolibacter pohnpeiensis TaxID=454153 RepID=A0A934S8I9_9BACT|nr:hypothetical protein [Luteolibacter pohnpeiensis]MBK1884117.1 hypothetical protein [Luteolibacter pohnpeiensis]